MKKITHKRFECSVFCLGACALTAWLAAGALRPSLASGQSPPTANHAAAQKKTVLFRGVLFTQRGEPLAHAVIRVGKVESKTNEDGGFVMQIRPGTYSLTIVSKKLSGALKHEVEVSPKGAELILTVSTNGYVDASMEGSEKRKTGQKKVLAKKETPSEPGKIEGFVRILDRNKGVKGAKVYVRGLPVEAVTDMTGKFVLELPAGVYDLSVVHPEYSAQTAAEVEVLAKKSVTLSIELTPTAFALEDFVVTIPRVEGATIALLDERKKASTMTEVLGAEQFSKSGDSSAASALRRVTGLTIVGGKFVYVRGLGGRYSSTLLNGSTLPSTEPDKRAVPLDLFPASLLESITIQKTYSADMPGDFGGGVVRLTSKSFPKGFQAGVSLSTGYANNTTFSQGLVFKRHWLDATGMDFGFRRLPAAVRDASRDTRVIVGTTYTRDDVERLGEELPNNWAREKMTLPPNFGVQGNIGAPFTLFGREAGVRAALIYNNSWRFDSWQRNMFDVTGSKELIPAESREIQSIENNITLSAMVVGGVLLGEDEDIKLTSLLTRVTDSSTVDYEGFSNEELSSLEGARARWLERQIMFHQLAGRHKLTGWGRLKWRYTFSQAAMMEPDRKDYQGIFDANADAFLLSRLADGHSRLYSELVDNNHDLGVDMTRPFSWWKEDDVKLSFGTQVVLKSREVDTLRYKYQDIQNLSDDVRAQDPSQVFVPTYIGKDQLKFEEITRPTDNYLGAQIIAGLYTMADWSISEAFSVQAGLRLEYSGQNVRTFDPYNAFAPPIEANLMNLDVLPALNFAWKFGENMQLRSALARTITRPNFRELSPAQFNEVGGGLQVEGNPELERSVVSHADMRWEWYPREGETLSAGVFYKFFERPIEKTYLPGATTRLTYINIDRGQNAGVEFEARKKLGFVHEVLDVLYVSANASFIFSRVDIEDPGTALTSKQRPLEGQSPYVLNGQLGFEEEELGLNAALLFNVSGPRIVALGSEGLPDTYEQPAPTMDIVVNQSLGNWKLSLKARDLLAPARQFTQGEKVFESFLGLGPSFSLGVGYKF